MSTQMSSLTATIGISPLINALKIMNNHYETKVVEEIEPLASGCYSCPYYNKNMNMCKQCDHKIMEAHTKKVYINEANRYGKRKFLRTKTLETFLLLHFNHPDANGLVYLDTDSFAQTLSCTTRTIRNNLILLEKYGYITHTKGEYPGNYKVFICNFKDNFKSFYQGGRGYIRLSYDTFESFLACSNINELRIVLREYINTVTMEEKTIVASKNKPFASIKNYLPHYITKNQIKNVVSGNAFKLIFESDVSKYTCNIEVLEHHNPLVFVEKIKYDCIHQLKDFMDLFNKGKEKNKLAAFHKPYFKISDDDYEDLSNVGLQYSIYEIEKALKEIYNKFVIPNNRIRKLGALVREICYSNQPFLQAV